MSVCVSLSLSLCLSGDMLVLHTLELPTVLIKTVKTFHSAIHQVD